MKKLSLSVKNDAWAIFPVDFFFSFLLHNTATKPNRFLMLDFTQADVLLDLFTDDYIRQKYIHQKKPPHVKDNFIKKNQGNSSGCRQNE